MPAALVQGQTVLSVWDSVPNPLELPDGTAVYCAQPGYVSGSYAVVPASYSIVSQSAALSSGQVLVTREWSAQPVPVFVTNAQARAALAMSTSPVSTSGTLLDTVDAAVTAAGGTAKIAWEYAYEVHRQGALINSLGKSTAIGLSDAQIDQLFIAAAAITF